MAAIAGPSFMPNSAHHHLLGERPTATQRPFAIVTQNLLALGAHRLDTLFRSTSSSTSSSSKDRDSSNPTYDEYDFLPIVYDSHADVVTGPAVSRAEARGYNDNNESGPSAGGAGASANASAGASPADDRPISTSLQNVAKLYQACQQAFGNTEPISFEYLGENDLDRKQCILTVTHPNGVSRSYITKPEFTRKSEAKACAATIAIEMGAIDFILHGTKNPGKNKILLAPVHKSSSSKGSDKNREKEVVESNEPSQHHQIVDCCKQWQAGRVVPKYTFYDSGKANDTVGCILTIELSPHRRKTYSVRPIYETRFEAKRRCCQLALEQGVLDFIKFGGGQTAPASLNEPDLPVDQVAMAAKLDSEICPRHEVRTTLQEFYDSLPKPFPEDVGDKLAAEINAPVMLNGIIQGARGAKLTVQFYFVSEPKTSLHSSILRIECPNYKEDKTYVVPAKFNKKVDAKAAVCLQAFSEGLGDYIRSVASRVDSQVTNDMRKVANEHILPVLATEYTKLRQGLHPVYTYDHDQGAFGCTMVLSLSSKPTPEETRQWSVTPEYRTKNDAKIAVVCLAGREAIEFVRFRGGPVPPGCDVFRHSLRTLEEGEIPEDEMRLPSAQSAKAKRKASQDFPSQSNKKNKSDASQSKRASKRQKVSLPKIQTNLPGSGPSKHQGTTRSSRSDRHPSTPSFIPPPPNIVSAAASAVIERLTGSSNTALLSSDSVPMLDVPEQIASSAIPGRRANQPTTHWPMVAEFSGNIPVYPIPAAVPQNSNDPSPTGTIELHPTLLPDGTFCPYPSVSPTDVSQTPPSSHFNPTLPTNIPTFPWSQPENRPVRVQDNVTPGASSQEVARDDMVIDRPLRTLQSDQEMLDKLRAKITRRQSGGKPPMKLDIAKVALNSAGSKRKYMDKLVEYCRIDGLTPEMYQDVAKKKDGTDGYKLWMHIGDKRLELPKVFSNVEEGAEYLAKKVVKWIQL